MRSTAKSKRELAVEAALIGVIAAQVRCEAEADVVTQQEADELDWIGRRLHEIAESMYDQSQPGVARVVFSLDVAHRMAALRELANR